MKEILTNNEHVYFINLINFTYKQEDKIYQNALKAIMIIFSAYAYFVDRQIIHYLEISLLNGIEMLR